MAKREGWEQRRRRGVQGKAVEYHIGSLPITILNSYNSEKSLLNMPRHGRIR